MILSVSQKDEKANQKKKESESDSNVGFSFTFPLRQLRGTKKNPLFWRSIRKGRKLGILRQHSQTPSF